MDRMLARTAGLVGLAVLPLVILSCSDASQSVSPELNPPPAARQIVDAVHSDGNPHFFWLPPMVGNPDAFAGPFDATLAPRVEICELSGEACATLVASYTTASGEGSETVRVMPDDEHYIVNWHTDEFDVGPGPTYRIHVFIVDIELGLADVQIGSTGKEVRNLTTDEIIGLKDGRTLPIKFRIEEGAVFAVDAEGGSYTTDDGRVTLTVPAGALTELVGISIEPWEGPYPEGQSLIPNTLFDFQPDGTVFSPPAEVTIAYDEADLGGLPESSLAVLTLVDGEWIEAEGSTVDEVANTVSGFIDGFSPKGAGGKVTSVDVTPASATLEIGETVQLTGDPKNAAGESVNRKVTWKSGDDAIATVDNAGLVTAVAEGTVTIEGRSGGAAGTSEVTVNPIDPCANIVITFEDANLEAVVRELEEIPDEGPITGEMAADVTSIFAVDRGIVSFEGLQCFSGLTNLTVLESEVSDLTPIAGLTGLTTLFVGDSPVTDLTPIAGMTQLEVLGLPRTQVTADALTVVSGFTELWFLRLDGLGLTDLAFVEGLSSLRRIIAEDNPITDISALEGLENLEYLSMRGGDIGGSEAVLGTLPALGVLFLTDMGAESLDFIAALNQLESLQMANNELSDVSALDGMSSLRYLTLNDNPGLGSADLGPLGTLANVEILSIPGSGISDVAFVSTMSSLKILTLFNNLISDATPILDLISLERLNLDANPITCDDPFYDQLAPTVNVTCNNPPIAYLNAPLDGEVFDEGETVAFSGAGSDPPHGTPGVALLTWSSDIDGVLGTGGTLSTTLTPGDHVITLTATDTHGGTGSASVTITVDPAAPPASLLVGDILASMLDEQEFQSRYGTDWVLADGRSAAGTAYQNLTGHASVPDLRAMFLRGLEPGGPREAGSVEEDDVGPHIHTFNVQPLGDNYVGGGAAPGWRPASFNPSPLPQYDLEIQPAGGVETRPRNAAVYFYIRVGDDSQDLTLHEVGVGDIVPSMLSVEEFQARHGTEWIPADGRGASGSDYAAATGLSKVPDIRGVFLRGVNGGRSDAFFDPVDYVTSIDGDPVITGTARPVGSLQVDQFASHTHQFNIQPLGNNYVGGGAAPGWRPASFNPSPIPQNDLRIEPNGGYDTRPNNVAFLFYIRIDEGDRSVVRDQVAVGDVVTSMLEPQAFMDQHGPGWRLADGQSAAGSPYETLTGHAIVPDLRGRFLRNVNAYCNTTACTLRGDPADKVINLDGTAHDPNSGPREAGSLQFADVRAHPHQLNVQPLGNNYVGGGAAPGWRPASYNPFPIPENDLEIRPGTGETRPNNVGVYFYIRIGE